MTDRPIPDEIAIRFAKLINAAEDMRQQAADDLKTIYADLRDDLKALGWGGKEISAELAGFKGAIAELRLDEQAKAKREAKGDRIDVYADLLRLAGARARIREGQSYAAQTGRGVEVEVDTPHDAETGEIIENQESGHGIDRNEAEPAVSVTAPAGSAPDAIPSTNSDATAPEPEATGLAPRATPSVGAMADSTGQATRPADESVAADDAAGEPNGVVRTNSNSDAATLLPAASEQPETPISSPVVSGAHSEPFEPPAFLRGEKAGCLKLRDGQCRLRFQTTALCSECNQERMRARALA